MMETLSKWAMLGGASYLQGMCLYGLFAVDLPARSGDPKAVQKALAHYRTRKEGISYKIVPVFCGLLVTGIFANLALHRDLSSLGVLGVAFASMMNNGKVVDAVNSLATSKEKEEQVLPQVLKGHAIDVFGLSAIFLGVFLGERTR
mmetsp:Transcript_11216/g.14762  ORF Transcript_11216/g.14762 Transcript_11216/m.14762 type:complete len:146 (-) Transcript_11216:74-511(-)|eukprot:CAMPEP_0198148166 /NCGR_PEP_ID=MMETSP1443-20131203/40221_1 /TAXON_ID=186043 /ORGANISM="Entomoneis sp., Strain CCMP2396" /LENGTH=145 /DNA_ID=CAMNT_0043812785 /DNA_START=67 /DNA_END=504 /DNA_ORIENTATION=-